MGLFSKNKNKKTDEAVQKVPKAEKIVFDSLKSDDDRYLTKLADQLMDGFPLILNFDTLDIDQANKVIAFLSGVVYATHGEILNVKEKVFMFASSDVYDDGSMDEFLKEIVE
ncbi:MAG: cell division protein SepF [Acholeplasmataceae bacterium]|jgi:cell division inhibitor SepF|nr:cell division protein SepF [Acholeplasmataceae bacterium]